MKPLLKDTPIRRMVQCVLVLACVLVAALAVFNLRGLLHTEDALDALLRETTALGHVDDELVRARQLLQQPQETRQAQDLAAALAAARTHFAAFVREAESHAPPPLLQALQTDFQAALNAYSRPDTADAGRASQALNASLERYARHANAHAATLAQAVQAERRASFIGMGVALAACMLLVFGDPAEPATLFGKSAAPASGVGAQAIGDGIPLIDPAACQTNLLALNAAVAAAATEIAALVADSSAAAEGARQVEAAHTALHDILDAAGQLDGMVGRVAAASAALAAQARQLQQAVALFRQTSHQKQEQLARDKL